MSKTIIVSNRLPIKITKEGESIDFKPSEGGLATGLGSIYKEGNNLWIGWPGIFSNDDQEQHLITEKLAQESMTPVFLTQQEIKGYYEGFSNATLWPIFHYFSQYTVFNKTFWKAYQLANQKFCDEIVKIAHPGDVVWVHDYQLLLLPAMLRDRLKDCSIGFFQHIPFSSYEVFRLLPWRKQIIEGMLGADLIGFHTYDDVRHFLSAVNRIAGIDDVNGQLEVDNRYAFVDAFPMGIDYEKYASVAVSETALQNEKDFRKSLGNIKLVLSIDRLDYSKGIPQKLQAFERFLRKNPDMQGKISLVMIVVPSRDKVKKYRELKEEIDELAGRINATYSTIHWRPVHYFYRSFPLEKLSAFYHMADIAFITPMRDGMNLVSKEFVASKSNQEGVLILSEMAGASKELFEALIVNPNDQDQMVDALEKAIKMPVKKQKENMRRMQSMVKMYDIHNWVEVFVERLEYVFHRQKMYTAKPIDEKTLTFIKERFEEASHRVILLDFDRLFLFSNRKEDSSYRNLKEESISLLKNLSQDSRNDLIGLTGADIQSLSDWVGEVNMDFIAEHGIWVKKKQEEWKTLENISNDWKIEIFPVLEHYVRRTPGSFIEEKDFSLVWHYQRVETGLGETRKRELREHLHHAVSNMNLSVLEEENLLEIKNALVNKGRSARYQLNERMPDLILAIGGSNSSEELFKAIPENSISVRVGLAPVTSARFSILDKKEVLKSIWQLSAVAQHSD